MGPDSLKANSLLQSRSLFLDIKVYLIGAHYVRNSAGENVLTGYLGAGKHHYFEPHFLTLKGYSRSSYRSMILAIVLMLVLLKTAATLKKVTLFSN